MDLTDLGASYFPIFLSRVLFPRVCEKAVWQLKMPTLSGSPPLDKSHQASIMFLQPGDTVPF